MKNIFTHFPQLKVFANIICFATILQLSGCGHIMYLSDSVPAQRIVDDAKAINADLWAPYEYYLAKALLEKAREEAAEASYQMSSRFAERAEEYADKAIQITRERKKMAEDAKALNKQPSPLPNSTNTPSQTSAGAQ